MFSPNKELWGLESEPYPIKSWVSTTWTNPSWAPLIYFISKSFSVGIGYATWYSTGIHVWTVKIWKRERWERECLAEGERESVRIWAVEGSDARWIPQRGTQFALKNLSFHLCKMAVHSYWALHNLQKDTSSAFKAVTNRFSSMTLLRKWWLCPAHTLLILRTLSLSELVEALIHCGRYLRSPFPWPIITMTIPLYPRYTVAFYNQLVVFSCFGEVDSWYS